MCFVRAYVTQPLSISYLPGRYLYLTDFPWVRVLMTKTIHAQEQQQQQQQQ